MGTKQLRDVLADANLGTALLWAEAEAVAEAASAIGEQGSEDQPSGTQAASAAVTAVTAAAAAVAPAQAAAPGVHRGFLGRAQAVQVEPLWTHARQQGLRLVLCGHSLGGAVAQLCTLRLLHLLRAAPPPADALRCIVFGCPAIGNTALADHVRQQAWDAHFLGISLPGG
jgi:alpha-beta hydrolase superfamily lysophospholipase